MRRWVFEWLLVFAGSNLSLGAQPTPIAFVGARVIPITGSEIPNGIVVIQNGKILAVGGPSTPVPARARRIDARNKVILPGLVDTHSHIGAVEGGDFSAALHPDVRALDSINVRDARIQKAQAGGITTVNIMPGSSLLMSGQTIYLKLRDGKTIEDLLIPGPDGKPAGGMKMANGTNPRGAPPRPGTRAKAAALMREQFLKAQEYREKLRAAAGDASKLPPRDLRMEALVEILDGKRVVHFHTHRHDDILTALRLAREFQFRVVLQHVSDGWAVAEEIAAAKAPCSLIVIDSPGGKLETKDNNYGTAAVLDRAGVLVGFHTDDSVTDSRFFLRSAALAVRAGLSREKALYAMTMAGAIMLDLEKRIGSLEPGKDADLILLDGDPLSIYTHVLETWVDGVKVFDREDPKDRLYATGGYGASHDQSEHVHLCGQEVE
ncbi:MAG: amidohydrolase family protein [Bryobacteraceae bacterium]|nr:amidohydrolase family protein [Bryobacteraceae bacterium]MDW8378043.1 amidohydrolase family protein [Bryobacterales bacterium]